MDASAKPPSALQGGEGALPDASPAHSTPRSHEKGPRVFLDYTQDELDDAYNQAAYMPHIQQLRDRWHSNSARTRSRLGPP
jgi:hypothetical protein